MSDSSRLKPADRALVADLLAQWDVHDDDAADALCEISQVRTLARGSHFLRAGEFATQIALVVTGLLREYFPLPDGRERSKAFVLEGRFSGSPTPSRAQTVLLT
jgi:CRP-like cAMP-binding protein